MKNICSKYPHSISTYKVFRDYNVFWISKTLPKLQYTSRCSWGCFTNTFVIISLTNWLTDSSFVKISLKHRLSQAVRARELTFWHNAHHPLCFMHHMSHVRCQVSHVMCHISVVMCNYCLKKKEKIPHTGDIESLDRCG